jgi:predicted transcriptional regulator
MSSKNPAMRVGPVVEKLKERQIEGIKKAVASLDRGEGAAHDDVKQWVKSWRHKRERPLHKRSRMNIR